VFASGGSACGVLSACDDIAAELCAQPEHGEAQRDADVVDDASSLLALGVGCPKCKKNRVRTVWVQKRGMARARL
jgi:hypothetical protein